MITKRKFFSMAIMMFVLFFLFQFSQVMKEDGNKYDENSHVKNINIDLEDIWNNEESTKVELGKQKENIIFVGGSDSEYGRIVRQWSDSIKRPLYVLKDLSECPEKLKDTVMVVEASALDLGEDTKPLCEFVRRGNILIFCELPKPEEIQENKDLMKLLDINKVVSTNVELKGINLFEGFLLGGQAIYEPKNEKEREERADLELNVPWYLNGNNSQTFMVGMLEDEKVKNERLPAIIWRSVFGQGKVYAVNADYLKDNMGIGFLDAMLSDASPYHIYPIVNSQGLAIANYSAFAKENAAKIDELYSRDMVALFRDVIWPGLWSTAEKNKSPLTYYIAPQMDYEDSEEPEKELLEFYLKQMKEQGSEAAWSADYVKGQGVREKMTRDREFISQEEIQYQFAAFYTPAKLRKEFLINTGNKLCKGLTTIACDYSNEQPVIGFQNKKTTLQMATSNGVRHTFMDDLRMKCLETALGYSSILMDMRQVSWPENEKQRWEVLVKDFFSNITTYWRPFEAFDKTTASEADAKVRTFLNTRFCHKRIGDEISVSVPSNRDEKEETSFILRTHNEEILRSENASVVEIEKGAYLVKASKAHFKLFLEKKDALTYKLP